MIHNYFEGLKQILYGTGEHEPQSEAVTQLAQETYNTNVLPQLINNLSKLDFEVRFIITDTFQLIILFHLQSKKDVALIFNNLLRRQIGTRSPTVEYVCARPDIIITLMAG
jgi:calcium binding protein 39